MNLIHETCIWGRGRFDGWVIPKAVYSRYLDELPSSCLIQVKKCRRDFVLLEAAGYTETGTLAQRLEVTLLGNCKMNRAIAPFQSLKASGGKTCKIQSCPPGSDVLRFSQKGLELFLKESGDTNPIHGGNPAVVPGLWIFNHLYQKHRRSRLPLEYRIRLLRPTCTGQAIILSSQENSVTGTCDGIAHFHMQINYL